MYPPPTHSQTHTKHPITPHAPWEVDPVQKRLDLRDPRPRRDRLDEHRQVGHENVREVEEPVGEEGAAGEAFPADLVVEEACDVCVWFFGGWVEGVSGSFFLFLLSTATRHPATPHTHFNHTKPKQNPNPNQKQNKKETRTHPSRSGTCTARGAPSRTSCPRPGTQSGRRWPR